MTLACNVLATATPVPVPEMTDEDALKGAVLQRLGFAAHFTRAL